MHSLYKAYVGVFWILGGEKEGEIWEERWHSCKLKLQVVQYNKIIRAHWASNCIFDDIDLQIVCNMFGEFAKQWAVDVSVC